MKASRVLAKESIRWSREEFGHARLRDARWTERLVQMGAQVAETPAGTVNSVFRDGASRQGAYGFLEAESFGHEQILDASYLATLRRLGDEPFAFVSLDKGAHSIVDRKKAKGLGPVSTSSRTQGVMTATAMVLSPEGVPYGFSALELWVRPKKRSKDKAAKRKVKDKETRFWPKAMKRTREGFAQHAPNCRPWFQIDREGDAWPIILEGLEPGQDFTIRAAWNRRLKHSEGGKYLWDTLGDGPILGHYFLQVPQGPRRVARLALMEVRAAPVTLDLKNKWTKQHFDAPLFVVYTREVSPAPAGHKPLEWMLLTSYEVHTLHDARLVIYGYSLRWRVEDFHKTWKSGACQAERTQLRSRRGIFKWLAILGARAMRIERLKHLARNDPKIPATEEFSQEEINAVLLLMGETPYQLGEVPSIGEMVRWLAQLGGHSGYPSARPPGSMVINRGLQRIEPVIVALRNLGLKPLPKPSE